MKSIKALFINDVEREECKVEQSETLDFRAEELIPGLTPVITIIGLFTIPVTVLAADSIKTVIQTIIGNVLKPVVPFVVSLTVAYFLWGTAMYIMYAGEAVKREEGRKMMLRGIIALAVMTCFWGVAKILVNTFGF